MNNKLPVLDIIRSGLLLPFERIGDLLRLGWPAALLLLAGPFIANEDESGWQYLGQTVLLIITGVLAMVGCHRVFILQADEARKTPTFRWGQRENGFIINLIVVSVLSLLAALPWVLVVSFFIFSDVFAVDENELQKAFVEVLMFLPIYYFLSRWSLLLPATAVDRENKLSWAWRLSRGNSLRLFVLVGLIPLVTDLLFEHILYFSETSILYKLIENTVWIVVGVIELSFLSLAYEWLMENHGWLEEKSAEES